MKRELIILGSTGSIGVQALEIVAAHPDRFEVIALTSAGSNPELLIEQAKKFKVKTVGVVSGADQIRAALPEVEVIDGADASSQIAAIHCDIVLNAITGSIGLGPTLAALDAGNHLALANKESLVAGGDIVMSRAKPHQILPVDSEHSALWQSMVGEKKSEIARLILTASGGPFRDRADLSTVTVAEALSHPTWVMGPVVTINSATLMNKGLEIIEAHYLFDIPYSQIQAVIHPQSIIHSMVEFSDGSTIAQASPPNMKGPIGFALGYPDRVKDSMPPLDWSTAHSWTFMPIDDAKFPAISLARSCGTEGKGLPAIYNAANEVAVSAFIAGDIAFTKIVAVVAKVVEQMRNGKTSTPRDFADVSALEQDARNAATLEVARIKL
jgi:1-deoxy-D-xylulose-5-phosphate reductoisomerase